MKRVVVTGMGIVSCFGNDVDQFYAKLLAGESGVKPLNFPCEDFTTTIAAQIHDFDPGEYIDKKLARRSDPFIAYGIVAGKKALESSGLKDFDPKRAGILLGSGVGGMSVFVDNAKIFEERGPKRVSPFFIPMILANMAGGLLAMDLNFMGPNYSISTACATSTQTIISAANHIRDGEADVMLCGGAEAPIIPLGVAGFCACKALSTRNDDPTKASRPWDKNRDGFVMGEGAGVLVLESLEHAQKRGATILAEYLGGGISCDAHHMTEPRSDGEGVATCITKALEDAGVTEDRVNYINAHATSTPVGDMAEVNAVKRVFKNPSKITMNATKSMIGHSLGAAGGIEAIAVVKAIQEGIVHPTINLTDPEEGLDFDVPTEAKKMEIDVAISNSFGFGGHNGTVVFTSFKG